MPAWMRCWAAGLPRGTNTLLCGPSGVGKTTTAVSCMLAAHSSAGETATYYLFDEGLATFLTRSLALNMDLRPHLDTGRLRINADRPGAAFALANSPAP